MTELNGQAEQMFPNVARLRNLTYAAPLFVDITKSLIQINGSRGKELRTLKSEVERVFVGRVPLMLKSTYCVLNQQTDKGLSCCVVLCCVVLCCVVLCCVVICYHLC
jgi:DNA-directed RNA polymerase II subunit RPB2